MEYFTLNNGFKMPVLGFGTCALSRQETEKSVSCALKTGYRLIDTANVYYNERAVGKAISDSGVKREDIFLTSKIWPKQYKTADDAIDATLDRLGTPYLDLLLLHRPYGDVCKGWEALERAVQKGKARSIGVSNFSFNQTTKLFKYAHITPAVIQSECHPYMAGFELRKKFADKGIRFESWFPLGHGDKGLLSESVFSALGKKYGKSAAQIVLRWHIDTGNAVIPGSKSAEHIRENFDIFDFKLSHEDLALIAGLDKNKSFFKVPDFMGRLTYRFTDENYEGQDSL